MKEKLTANWAISRCGNVSTYANNKLFFTRDPNKIILSVSRCWSRDETKFTVQHVVAAKFLLRLCANYVCPITCRWCRAAEIARITRYPEIYRNIIRRKNHRRTVFTMPPMPQTMKRFTEHIGKETRVIRRVQSRGIFRHNLSYDINREISFFNK